MNILIGLVPALTWGMLPLVVRKTGGKPANQLFGTALGTFLVGLAVLAMLRPALAPQDFFISFVSGAFWACGQMLQYSAYVELGVSKTLPVMTGMQLVGTSLLGVLALGEWPGMQRKLLGFFAILLIIAGAWATTYRQDKTAAQSGNQRKGLVMVALASLCYITYSAFPRLAQADGWALFFPQTLGIFVVAVALALAFTRGTAAKEKKSWQNLPGGVVFAVGALAYLLSAQRNGLVVGFALTQMNVVLATLGGILVLGEKKTKKEFAAVLFGLLLVVSGGILVNLI